MATLPKLTEQDVREWSTPDYFKRGVGYYNQNHIYNPRRAGQTLKGRCQGSMPEPYRIEIILGPSGIIQGNCSCPIGGGGYCKHAVALLLTWVYEPETFTEVAALEDVLRNRSQDDLVALILRMLDRAPELESLVELEVLADQESDVGIDAARIQQQVWNALNSGHGNWQDGYYISDQLYEILRLATRALELSHWQSAITVYTTVAGTVLAGFQDVYDDEGDLFNVINDCLAGLGKCLSHIEDAETREHLLHELFRFYSWDLSAGGYGVGDEVPVIIEKWATPKERALVAGWVREALPQVREWGRKTLGGFLLKLEANTLDDAAYLQLCRESGRVRDLIQRLLQLDRIDEALEAARASSDYDLWRIADIFLTHKAGAHIHPLIAERAQTSRDSRLKTWLKDYAKAHNDPESAFRWTETLFNTSPSLNLYDELKALAQTLGRWDTTRDAMIAQLSAKNPGFLVRLYLHGGENDAALDTLAFMEHKSRTAHGMRHHTAHLRLDVAQAVAETHPHQAIELYLTEIRRLIAARGRSNYASAAQLLLRVREIYKRIEETAQWQTLIRDLRLENKNLPAMQDEFNRAGLQGKS